VNGCVNTAQTTVTVNANPTINGPNNVCVGSLIQLTASPTPAATNAWTSSNAAIAAISNSGLVTAISPGTTTITYVNNNNCSVTAWITVNPLPAISGNNTLCVGSTTQLTGTFAPAANNAWSSSNTAVATVSNTGNVNAISAGSVVITYTNNLGCSASISITVNPNPTITNSPLTQSICSGSTTTAVTWTSSIPGTTYNWTGTASASITGYTVSGTGNLGLMNTIQNSGNSNGNLTYTVTPTSNGCVGSPVTYVIVVKPTPLLSQFTSQTICGGISTTTTSFVNSVAGGSFNYSLLNPGAIPASVTGFSGNGTGQIPGSVINNGGTNPYTLSYAVVPTASGCNGPSGTFQITVNPAAVTTFSAGNQTICSGQNTNLVNLSSSTPNVSISWTLPGGVPQGIVGLNPNQGGANIPAFNSLVNNTNSPIQILFDAQASNGPNACIGAVATYTITVNPLPSLTSASSLDACSGLFLNFSLTTNVPSSFAWVADTNVNVTGESLTTQNSSIINNMLTLANPLSTDTVNYFITPTSSIGACVGTTQQLVVTVHPIPAMTSLNSAVICSGTALNFPLSSNLPSSFSWVANANASVSGESLNPVISSTISDNLSHNSLTNQTVTYSVTPISLAGSCSGIPLQVQVTVKPIPVITSPNSTSVCSNIPLNVNLVANIPSSITWIANTNPNVNGESLTLQNNAILNNTLTQSTLIPQNVIYTITPTSTIGGCQGNPQTLTVTVNPLPTMTSGTTAAICSGTPLNFSLSSNISSNYSWYASANPIVFGESTTAQNTPIINNTLTQSTLISQSVTYTVIPTSSLGGCIGSSQTLTITVNPLPLMTSSNTASICSGTPLNFSLSSDIASSFTWLATNNMNVTGESLTAVNSNFINNTLFHTSSQNQELVTYTITPTSTLGLCMGTPQILTVTVNPLPDSTISANGPTEFCSGGGVGLSVPQLNGNSYTWSFNNSTILGGVGSAYYASQTGVYSVQIVNQYNCSSNDSISITSLNVPVAIINNPAPANFSCQGSQVTLNSASNCVGCNLTYQWLNNNLNPIQGANSATYSYTANSTGNIYLVISNNLNGVSCADTSTNILITVLVNQNPTFNLPDSICVNDTYLLPQLSNNLISGNWNHPSITSPYTSYTFTPLSGQCALTYTWNVTLAQLPLPNLGNDTTICSGEAVNLSLQGFNSYIWNNGSVNSVIQVSPVSTELITVSVTDNLGCIGYDSLTINVNPNPATPVIVGVESVCLNSLNQVYSSSPSSNWLIWNINGANIYSGQHTNQVHLDVTALDSVWIELTEHVLETGCFATGSLLVIVDTTAVAPPYVNVLPLGNDNDLLCAPQATNVIRWGKMNKLTNLIYLEPSGLTYHNFISLDTSVYYYFVDHGGDGCYTRSYYNYPELVTEVEDVQEVGFWLAPNPVQTELRIMSDTQSFNSLSIENLEGKCVYQGSHWTNTPIDCANFMPGMYFVKIKNGLKSYVIKFLKL
jgi:hypothetical protein